MLPSFDHHLSTELCSIMEKYGSDKGSSDMKGWHNYTTLYHALFADKRTVVTNVFELGLGTNFTDVPSNMGVHGKPGASHHGWAEYFPNAHVYGADIDRRILFNTDRITTYYCDQTNPDTIKQMWNKIPYDFDVIVEDGLHTFSANKCFFENSIHKLAVGGTYIIEDILNKEVYLFEQQVRAWEAQYPSFSFEMVRIPHHNTFDNRLLVIKRIA